MQDARFDWRPSLVLMGLALVLMAGKAGEIWSGILPGNDDMMRLVQVRDWLAGQGLHTVDQSRFITPEGGAMHWSRLPDLFLAAIIVLLTPLIGQIQAEYAAVMVWPACLLMLTMAMMALILRRLGAGTAGAAFALFFFITSKSVYQFWPGRIDHHGLELALVSVALAALLSPRASGRSGALAGLCVATMLSVAIESLPYAGALIGVAGLLWIIRGGKESQRLAGFGGAAAVGGFLAYFADAPGPGAARAVCDAFGNFHLAALLAGGALLALVAAFSQRLSGWQQRLGVGGVAGAATLAIAGLTAPGCFASPYASVSADAVANWLSSVGEARSLPVVLAVDPVMAIGDFAFVVVGLAAGVWRVWRAPEGSRIGWVAIVLLLVLSATVMIWQIRGVLFAHLFAALPAGVVAGIAFMRWRRAGGPRALLVASALTLALAPSSWVVFARIIAPAKAEIPGGVDYAAICREPGAYDALAKLPAARVFAPIDLGTSILLRTDHSVFAAPYHRNSEAIAQVTAIFMSSPEDARLALGQLKADYLVYCRGLGEFGHYRNKAPASLAAALMDGDIPHWLQAGDGDMQVKSAVRVFTIVPPVSDTDALTQGLAQRQ